VAVAAPVEPVALVFAGGCFDRAGAAERGEGRFVAESAGVLAGGDDELGGDVGADAGFGQQRRDETVEQVS